MANITRSTTASGDVNSLMNAVYVSGLFAGEDISAVSPCYISASGTVLMSKQAQKTGTVTDFIGVSPKSYKSGEAITLFGKGARFSYATGLTAGVPLFTSASAGYLDTTALTTTVTGSAVIADAPVAVCINTTDILIVR
jgi:hypothetical protein